MSIPVERITELRDTEATAQRIREAIEDLGRRVQPGDRVFVYYSGHGTRWRDPALGAEACTEGLLASDGVALTSADLGALLDPVARRADKLFVFYDACFSGGVAAVPSRSLAAGRVTPRFSPPDAASACSRPSNYRSRSLALVMAERGRPPENLIQVASALPDEVAFDSSLLGGFGTTAWRDCLVGEAGDLDASGAVTIQEVTRCAQRKVDAALAVYPEVLGQHYLIGGNAGFVPAWSPAASPAPERAVSPAALLAEVHAQRDGARLLPVRLASTQLRIGRDRLALTVLPERDGHLYVMLAGSDERNLYLLYPNALAGDNAVRAGQVVGLPDARWSITADGPAGRNHLLVMLSDGPRDWRALRGEAAGPFVKTLLDAEGRARLQWMLGHRADAATCGARGGTGGCADAFASTLLTVDEVP
jgi:hypothetical protein